MPWLGPMPSPARTRPSLRESPTGSLSLIPSGQAIVANPAIGRILGISSQELFGPRHRVHDEQDVAAEEREIIVAMLREGGQLRSGLKFGWGEKTLSVSFAPVRGQED